MKALVLLLTAVGIGMAAICAVSPKPATSMSKPTVIDGAQTPELIPDRVAYSLMFQLVSSPANEVEQRHLSAYIAEIGFESDADAKALVAAAAEYKRRVGAVDSAVNAIKAEGRGASGRPPEVRDRLLKLRAERDSITDDVVSSLPNVMSREGLSKLRSFIDERVKKKTKLRPGSSSAL